MNNFLFKVFFREKICADNPEGKMWREVPLPKLDLNVVLSCSCSASGIAGFITMTGSVLIRTGISRNEPYGKNWIEIPKSNDIGLRQMCMGSQAIWAIDNKGCKLIF
jgi:hypothetical protein